MSERDGSALATLPLHEVGKWHVAACAPQRPIKCCARPSLVLHSSMQQTLLTVR